MSTTESEPEKLSSGVEVGSIMVHQEGDFVITGEDDEDGSLLVRELGDSLLDECPVIEGGECIDHRCDGRIGENERDEDSLSAHELYCYGCGLNWVERNSYWEETYADWPTSFSYNED